MKTLVISSGHTTHILPGRRQRALMVSNHQWVLNAARHPPHSSGPFSLHSPPDSALESLLSLCSVPQYPPQTPGLQRSHHVSEEAHKSYITLPVSSPRNPFGVFRLNVMNSSPPNHSLLLVSWSHQRQLRSLTHRVPQSQRLCLHPLLSPDDMVQVCSTSGCSFLSSPIAVTLVQSPNLSSPMEISQASRVSIHPKPGPQSYSPKVWL